MVLVVVTLASLEAQRALQADYFEAPAGDAYARVVPGGLTVLPNGRLLTPRGKRLYGLENVWQTLVSPDGRLLVIFHDDGLTVYTNPTGAKPERALVPVKGVAPAGCFSPDGSRLFVSKGENGQVLSFDTKTWTVLSTIESNVLGAVGSYVNDLVTRDGRWLYGVDVANQDLLLFDVQHSRLAHRVPAGRQPYALALTADRAYVANIGLFDYSVIPKSVSPEAVYKSGITRPAFAFPSIEAEKGVRFEGREVPGLGKHDVPGAQSVYAYSTTTGEAPRRLMQVKTGLMIRAAQDGREVVGGSAPNAVLASGTSLWVSNANNDTVQEFDARSLELKRTVSLAPSPVFRRLRGVIPSGMAFDPKRHRLYVCESGLNSVAVIDADKGRLIGRFPTGWFPMQVRLSPDAKTVYVACHKGIGRGPRGTENSRTADDERFGLPEFPGMVAVVPVPTDRSLSEDTKVVARNNGLVSRKDLAAKLPQSPIPMEPGQRSKQIKHVVFITKENHTFDGIFGGLQGAKGKADYAEFGMQGWIAEKGKSERLPIMPNHIKLAERFAISDNFYMEPQASGDGHRWLIGVYPSLWTSRVFYAGWDFRADDRTKGRLSSMGSNGSQIPEDYLENGSMWEHFERGGIRFRNYGEGWEFPGSDEPDDPDRTGTEMFVNHPLNRALWKNTCFEYPMYNNSIPDIARVEWLIEDVEKNFRAKGKPLPEFMNVTLCNDHGSGARPADGYPYVCSFMADNDLALGRLVEWLSKQPEWESTAVFVTQDDSGGDNDHVDRHRSFVLALGPWAKKGYVSHRHTSIMSILKTIYMIFGLGPNNMFDAVATDLRDMFTLDHDARGYTSVDTDPRVFVAEKAYDVNDPRFKGRKWAKSPTKMDDPEFVEKMRRQSGGGLAPSFRAESRSEDTERGRGF